METCPQDTHPLGPLGDGRGLCVCDGNRSHLYCPESGGRGRLHVPFLVGCVKEVTMHCLKSFHISFVKDPSY